VVNILWQYTLDLVQEEEDITDARHSLINKVNARHENVPRPSKANIPQVAKSAHMPTPIELLRLNYDPATEKRQQTIDHNHGEGELKAAQKEAPWNSKRPHSIIRLGNGYRSQHPACFLFDGEPQTTQTQRTRVFLLLILL